MAETKEFLKELKSKRRISNKRIREYETLIRKEEKQLELLNKLIKNLEQANEVEH